MPLPGWLGRFNRGATNRLTGLFAGSAPGFGMVIHTGRRSGRRYRTPVNVFRAGDEYVVALTYGRHRDWVRNVMAANGCDIESRRVSRHLVDPRIVTDPGLGLVPAAIRPILMAIGVTEFMVLRPGVSRPPNSATPTV